MNNLYTASEAREKLGGISAEALKRLVEAGKVHKETPPTNKKRGYYKKTDVDRLAEAMEDFIEIHTTLPEGDTVELVQAEGKDDIRETTQIARQHFGDNAYDVEKRMTWFRLAPNGDYVLKHGDIIVGYISMQAIKPEAVEHIFNRRNGSSVQLEDMEPIVPGKPLELHISGIGVKTGIKRQDAKRYGADLITGLIKVFMQFASKGIEVKRVWSKSSTVPGIKLSRDLGFTELGYINNEQIGFVLDFEPDKATKPLVKKFLQKYCETLEENKKSHRTTKILASKNKK